MNDGNHTRSTGGTDGSRPLSLYVHLPWCVRKCPYCDFNSHALSGELPAERYTDALLRDLDYALDQLESQPLVSVFLGGGTPSLFPAGQLARLLDRLRDSGWLGRDAEITLEANPGTIERHSFRSFAAAGINRVSLGAQSFDPAKLAALGRIHSPDDTCRAAADLHAAGISNFNIDVMYALPGQQPEEYLADLEAALALAPAHLSAYQLTIEPNTAFARHPPDLPCEDAVLAMEQPGQDFLATAGFMQYEVSAYARTGAECRHNRNYWEYGDYLGIGAGAHQKLSAPPGRITRQKRRAHPGQYQRHAGSDRCVAERHEVQPEERIFEFMLNALRLCDGFDRKLFEERTFLSWSTLKPQLEVAAARGLMIRDHGRWRASPLGWRFLNDVQAMFLPPGEAA